MMIRLVIALLMLCGPSFAQRIEPCLAQNLGQDQAKASEQPVAEPRVGSRKKSVQLARKRSTDNYILVSTPIAENGTARPTFCQLCVAIPTKLGSRRILGQPR